MVLCLFCIAWGWQRWPLRKMLIVWAIFTPIQMILSMLSLDNQMRAFGVGLHHVSAGAWIGFALNVAAGTGAFVTVYYWIGRGLRRLIRGKRPSATTIDEAAAVQVQRP